MRKTFTSSGYDYVFEVIRGNEIVFYLESGLGDGSEKDLFTDEFGYPTSAVRDLNCIKNPTAVFRQVRKLFLEYLLSKNILYFCFRGNPERLRLYERFAKRLEGFGYSHTFHEGQFTFFKVAIGPHSKRSAT